MHREPNYLWVSRKTLVYSQCDWIGVGATFKPLSNLSITGDGYIDLYTPSNMGLFWGLASHMAYGDGLETVTTGYNTIWEPFFPGVQWQLGCVLQTIYLKVFGNKSQIPYSLALPFEGRHEYYSCSTFDLAMWSDIEQPPREGCKAELMADKNGMPNELHNNIYKAWDNGGWGLIITGKSHLQTEISTD